VKKYREKGAAGFFAPRPTRGARVLTDEVLAKVQAKLDEGLHPSLVSDQLGLKRDTVRKAIAAGRLHRPKKKSQIVESVEIVPSTKSARSVEDNSAPIGVGATNELARVAASLGKMNGVPTQFQPSVDVPRGGVLFALPSLLVCGLLKHTEECFTMSPGYYAMDAIFLLLSFMALCGIESIERLRIEPPGEWGKLLGLDRIPEVRTLRGKVQMMSKDGQSDKWGALLCEMWMNDSPQEASILYVDGHVRVYNGHQTKLPRHHVARQRLCLRATTDYWVNAMDGQPFFLISKTVDPGLIKVLEDEIVPRLINEVPDQPSEEELEADEFLIRFTLIFDREGYSPDFMLRMKKLGIACLTYHKFPGKDWSDEEFKIHSVKLASGEIVEMALAERGTFLGGKIWVREVRKRKTNGGQTAILITDYRTDAVLLAAAMFARWSQENFFRYMRIHYGLDRLVDYRVEEIPETTKVVNPEHRNLDGKVRRQVSLLSRKLAEFGAMSLEGPIEPKKMEQHLQDKAKLHEEIEQMQADVAELKAKRKATDRHIPITQLPEDKQFKQLSSGSKHFIDTIKMISYRAETAMSHVLKEQMKRPNDARSLLRGIYNTTADIYPDEEKGTLTIKLHHLANHCSDESLHHLCAELNETETIFPGTNLRLVYESVTSLNSANSNAQN